jgi:hypothetical protein
MNPTAPGSLELGSTVIENSANVDGCRGVGHAVRAVDGLALARDSGAASRAAARPTGRAAARAACAWAAGADVGAVIVVTARGDAERQDGDGRREGQGSPRAARGRVDVLTTHLLRL